MVETLELVTDDLLAIGLSEVKLECLLPELILLRSMSICELPVGSSLRGLGVREGVRGR
jgi:hypothetical protein